MGLINFILNNKKAFVRILIILVVILFVLFSKNGIIDRLELSSQKSKAINQLYNQLKTNDSLTKYYFKILFDSTEIERIARHKYGMIKPGEDLYIIDEEK